MKKTFGKCWAFCSRQSCVPQGAWELHSFQQELCWGRPCSVCNTWAVVLCWVQGNPAAAQRKWSFLMLHKTGSASVWFENASHTVRTAHGFSQCDDLLWCLLPKAMQILGRHSFCSLWNQAVFPLLLMESELSWSSAIQMSNHNTKLFCFEILFFRLLKT